MFKRHKRRDSRKLAVCFIIKRKFAALKHLQSGICGHEHAPQGQAPAAVGIILDGRQAYINSSRKLAGFRNEFGERTRTGFRRCGITPARCRIW